MSANIRGRRPNIEQHLSGFRERKSGSESSFQQGVLCVGALFGKGPTIKRSYRRAGGFCGSKE